MGWWLQLTINILAFLLLMVNFKWLTIFTCVAVRVVAAFNDIVSLNRIVARKNTVNFFYD